jgi:hypothetical protein
VRVDLRVGPRPRFVGAFCSKRGTHFGVCWIFNIKSEGLSELNARAMRSINLNLKNDLEDGVIIYRVAYNDGLEVGSHIYDVLVAHIVVVFCANCVMELVFFK